MRYTITAVMFIMLLAAQVSFGQAIGNGFQAQQTNPFDSVVQVSDQKAGSVVVFPFYGSDGTTLNDTRMTITNVGPAGFAGAPAVPNSVGSTTDILNNLNVHLFFIDNTCAEANGYICFTKYQSWTFKASEWDPYTTKGILIAVCEDPMGNPISYNGLIGSAFVNSDVTLPSPATTDKWVGSYGAEAFASLGRTLNPLPAGQVYWYTTTATPANPLSIATLPFNNGPRRGIPGYDAAPNAFAAEFQSPNDSIGQTVLTISFNGAIGTTLTGNGFALPGVGLIYRDDEKGYSFNGPGDSCMQFIRITATNPRTTPPIGGQFPSGHSGTMLWTTNGPALGLFVTPRAANQAWQGIRTLHKRNVTETGTLTISILMPTCVI